MVIEETYKTSRLYSPNLSGEDILLYVDSQLCWIQDTVYSCTHKRKSFRVTHTQLHSRVDIPPPSMLQCIS